MYIKKIIIEKNGKLSQNLIFNKKLSVVKGSAELYDVIKLLLGKCEAANTLHNIKFYAEVKLHDVYCIRGRKEKGELLFNVSVCRGESDTDCTNEYFETVRQSTEMESALFFHRFKRQDYPHKLVRYRDVLKYYPDGDFDALTNGYGSTRSFRGFMTQYITHFKPLKLREDREMYLKLSKDGEFGVGYLNSNEKVFLSETENTLYHYLSFISIADFWDRAEKIRNMNRVKKPLVVTALLERIADDFDISQILRKTNSLDRQTILFTEKENRQTEYDI